MPLPFARWAITAILLLDLTGYVLHIGRISFFVGAFGRTAAIGAELAAIAMGGIACVALGLWRPLAAGLVLALYIAAQAILFSRHFGTEIKPAVQAVYLGWLSVLVFAPAIRVLPPRRLINLLLLVTLGYAVFYILLSLQVPGFQPPAESDELLSLKAEAAIGRPARFVMLSSMLGFGVYVSLTRIVREGRWVYVASLLLCSAAIWLSYSRISTLMIALVALGYVVTRRVRLIGSAGLAAFILVGAILVGGLFTPNFYPFDPFGTRDLSAVARAHEYALLRHLIPTYWTTGVGFTPGQDATAVVMSYPWFYSADLGAAGVFYEGGVIGLLVFLGFSVLNAFPAGKLARLGYDRGSAEALSLTGCACVMFGVLWPELWNGTATLFGGLFLAVALVSPRAERCG